MIHQALDKTPTSGWPASLALGFVSAEHKTRLTTARHCGPLRIQRPFYPEGGVCHVYLLHPPGGLVAGDSLDISATLGPQSHALLTTPAAGKIYCSNPAGEAQIQHVTLEVQEGAVLEWLPQETIVFDRANGEQSTEIRLQGSAQTIAWELTCLGRPAGDFLLTDGSLKQQLAVWRDDKPLLIERTPLVAGPMMHQPWGLGGHTVYGTWVATCDDAAKLRELVEQLRDQARFQPLAFTQLPGLLLARYLGSDAETGRELFMQLWQVLRPELLGLDACRPRIWDT